MEKANWLVQPASQETAVRCRICRSAAVISVRCPPIEKKCSIIALLPQFESAAIGNLTTLPAGQHIAFVTAYRSCRRKKRGVHLRSLAVDPMQPDHWPNRL